MPLHDYHELFDFRKNVYDQMIPVLAGYYNGRTRYLTKDEAITELNVEIVILKNNIEDRRTERDKAIKDIKHREGIIKYSVDECNALRKMSILKFIWYKLTN